MINVRLIYEQIEAGKSYLLSGSVLGYRLALILLDNTAELLMHRELENEFAFSDNLRPKWEPAYTEWLQAGRGPKYTADERKAAEREFEPKTRILCLRLGRISPEDRRILTVCHRLRGETFHRGTLRQSILAQVTKLLYLTVVELTVKLPIHGLIEPTSDFDPDGVKFLQRFGFNYGSALLSHNGRRRLADHLLVGLNFDPSAFRATLADDLIERIDGMLESMEYIGGTTDRAQIDRNLQFGQFWQEMGVMLANRGVREPELTTAFCQWQSEGRTTYTLEKIARWRQQAEAIRRCKTPGSALDLYGATDKRLRPLEDDVMEAVFRYDEEIDMRIKDRHW
jgi:hypothetical protein